MLLFFLTSFYIPNLLLLPPKEEYYQSVDMDGCLCQVDVEKALTIHNIPFKTDCGDFYVGKLDEVVGYTD